MKVLGDQAIADPSKVEWKVLQQMRQRVMNHEMRNLAAKKVTTIVDTMIPLPAFYCIKCNQPL